MRADSGVDHTACVRGGWGCRLKACRVIGYVLLLGAWVVPWNIPATFPKTSLKGWNLPRPQWYEPDERCAESRLLQPEGGKLCRSEHNLISASVHPGLRSRTTLWRQKERKGEKTIRGDGQRNNAEMLRSHFSELIQVFTRNTCYLFASTTARVDERLEGMTAAHLAVPWCVFGGINAWHSLNIAACPL